MLQSKHHLALKGKVEIQEDMEKGRTRKEKGEDPSPPLPSCHTSPPFANTRISDSVVCERDRACIIVYVLCSVFEWVSSGIKNMDVRLIFLSVPLTKRPRAGFGNPLLPKLRTY